MPRQDEQDLYYKFLNQGSDNVDKLGSMTSQFRGINTAGDVRSRFGIGDNSNDIYAPLRRNLASARGGALARVSARSGGSATPESSLFNPIEQGYASQEGSLASSQGQTDAATQKFVSQLLQGSMGAQDQFGLQKSNELGGLLGGLNSQVNQHRQTDFGMQDPNFMDYLMTIIGKGAPVAAAALS